MTGSIIDLSKAVDTFRHA